MIYLKFLITILLSLAVSMSLAQDDSKKKKKKTKEEKKQEAIELQEAIVQIAETRRWVLEAHTLYDRYGSAYPLTPTINFVGLDSVIATIQLSFEQLIGWNGIGGVTLDGKVTKHNVKPKKPGKGVGIQVRAVGQPQGSVDIFVEVSTDFSATVDFSTNTSTRLSFAGRFVPLEMSSVYKGATLTR